MGLYRCETSTTTRNIRYGSIMVYSSSGKLGWFPSIDNASRQTRSVYVCLCQSKETKPSGACNDFIDINTQVDQFLNDFSCRVSVFSILGHLKEFKVLFEPSMYLLYAQLRQMVSGLIANMGTACRSFNRQTWNNAYESRWFTRMISRAIFDGKLLDCQRVDIDPRPIDTIADFPK